MKIELQNIYFKYDNNFIIKNMSQVFKNGKIHFIKGNNGVGKTTLLKLILNSLEPELGKIKYDDISYQEFIKSYSISFVSNDIYLYEDLTFRDNLSIFFSLNDKKLKYYLEKFNMLNFLDIEFSKFSSGMAKKAILIIFLSNNSDIYLFDEPFLNLDNNSSLFLQKEIIELSLENKLIFLVSHSIEKLDNSSYYLLDNENIKVIS